MKSIVLLGLVACAPDSASPKLDGGKHVDAGHHDTTLPGDDQQLQPEAPNTPYSHAIAIDGVDDFTSGETFGTTSSPSFAARVTWDATNVYLGYSGPDIAGTSGAPTKWVFAYVDVDPGASPVTGAATSLKYNTQTATFPTGFGAELYARWKCDDSLASIEVYDGASYTTSPTALAHARTADFVEFAIPRALFPGATTIGVETYMINEANGAEGTYAGLYPGNFTDGYAAAMPLTKYLKIDFAATRTPNDAANTAP